MGNTYYKWTYNLENGTMEVKEQPFEVPEPLDEVYLSIDDSGTTRVYMMISKHNDKTGEKKFIKGIADVLQSDMLDKARIYNLSFERFQKFSKFLKGRESEDVE